MHLPVLRSFHVMPNKGRSLVRSSKDRFSLFTSKHKSFKKIKKRKPGDYNGSSYVTNHCSRHICRIDLVVEGIEFAANLLPSSIIRYSAEEITGSGDLSPKGSFDVRLLKHAVHLKSSVGDALELRIGDLFCRLNRTKVSRSSRAATSLNRSIRLKKQRRKEKLCHKLLFSPLFL